MLNDVVIVHCSAVLIKYNYNDQVKENEMGRACSTNREKRNAYSHWILVRKARRKEATRKTKTYVY
jgi:hypothetical protein